MLGVPSRFTHCLFIILCRSTTQGPATHHASVAVQEVHVLTEEEEDEEGRVDDPVESQHRVDLLVVEGKHTFPSANSSH